MNKRSLLLKNSSVEINNTEKFGLLQFLQSITNSIPMPRLWLPNNDYDYMGSFQIKEKIEKNGLNFLSNIEIDYVTLLQRQEFIKWFFGNKEFINFLLTTTVPVKKSSGNRYSDVTDVLAMRRYLSNLLKYLEEHPYSASFAKKVKKELSDFRQIDSLVSSCHSITLQGVCSFTPENHSRKFFLNTKNLELKLVGKNKKYILTIIDFLEGNVDSMKCCLEQKGGDSKMPYDICEAIFYAIFTLYNDDIKKISENKKGNVHIKLEFSDIQLRSVQCMLSVQGFGKKHVLYPVKVDPTSNSYETVEFHVLPENDSITKHRILTKVLPIQKLMDLPGKESAGLSNGFINKMTNTVSEFFRQSDSFKELIFLASIAHYYHKSGKVFVFPKILPKEEMKLKSIASINPLFIDAKKSVPNNVMLNRKILANVIYGANTGGKTGYVNMFILNQILTQTGLPIFAKNAEISMKDNILLHYPEGAEISPNESRFDAELSRLETLLKQSTKYSLIVFDEAFTGTEAEVGSSQLQDVIFVLKTLGCHFMVTTHFHGLIDFIDKMESLENKHFKLPNPNGVKKFNYKIQPNGSTQSFGLDVIRRKKLDLESMLKLVEKKTT